MKLFVFNGYLVDEIDEWFDVGVDLFVGFLLVVGDGCYSVVWNCYSDFNVGFFKSG